MANGDQEYRICEANTARKLDDEVNSNLNLGWKLHGPLHVGHGPEFTYTQALVYTVGE